MGLPEVVGSNPGTPKYVPRDARTSVASGVCAAAATCAALSSRGSFVMDAR